MKKKTIVGLIAIIVIGLAVFFAGCIEEKTKPPEVTTPPEEISTPAEEKRPMTYYSAKQAFARLTLYLRKHNQPPPKLIWGAIPTRIAVYSSGKSGQLSGVVGGWVFIYEDEFGKLYRASLNCWGGIRIEEDLKEEDLKFAENYPRAVRIDEWILDNINAHRLVLSRGGEGRPNEFGGRLMTASVEGRGTRPVWAGGAWFMPDERCLIAVDAQTGELYRQTGEKKLEPISPEKRVDAEWDGGFDSASYGAIRSRSEYHHWWPRAYITFEREFVYNRELLKEKLQEEQVKPNRDAASWMTSGILQVVLGNWVEAINDFDEAVKLDPENEDYRYYRGRCFLCIRDLDKASADFQALPEEDNRRKGALGYVAMFRGEKERNGLLSSMESISTNCGMVPWEIQVGPVHLTSYRYK